MKILAMEYPKKLHVIILRTKLCADKCHEEKFKKQEQKVYITQ